MIRSDKKLVAALVILIGAGPATKPIRSLSDVESSYQDKIVIATKQYRGAMTDAAEERLRNLHVLENRALQDQDIDAAASLREKIREAETGEAELKRLSSNERNDEINWLHQQLDGTLWHWGTDTDFIRFKTDGTVGNAEWSARNLVTHWKVIDTRTVLFTISKGRRENLTAILQFTPKIDSFAGVGFDGGTLPANKQQVESTPKH